jgi:hypothetical protein
MKITINWSGLLILVILTLLLGWKLLVVFAFLTTLGLAIEHFFKGNKKQNGTTRT